mmetsp:Transcript_4/g.18  ORF Transcript_4/g.18 Transcript_4/m.18 type:complete len:202 (-) Transcript_4:926-1531(-)
MYMERSQHVHVRKLHDGIEGALPQIGPFDGDVELFTIISKVRESKVVQHTTKIVYLHPQIFRFLAVVPGDYVAKDINLNLSRHTLSVANRLRQGDENISFLLHAFPLNLFAAHKDPPRLSPLCRSHDLTPSVHQLAHHRSRSVPPQDRGVPLQNLSRLLRHLSRRQHPAMPPPVLASLPLPLSLLHRLESSGPRADRSSSG